MENEVDMNGDYYGQKCFKTTQIGSWMHLGFYVILVAMMMMTPRKFSYERNTY